MGPIDGYATHLPVLLACLRSTTGPILELGAGIYSTPLVRAFSVQRYARTIEADPDWAARVRRLVEPAPAPFRFELRVGRYVSDASDPQWDVALVDHRTADRAPDLEALRAAGAGLIVVHDTEDAGYGLEPVLAKFRHRFDYTRLAPHTTVVSDSYRLDWLEAALAPLW